MLVYSKTCIISVSVMCILRRWIKTGVEQLQTWKYVHQFDSSFLPSLCLSSPSLFPSCPSLAKDSLVLTSKYKQKIKSTLLENRQQSVYKCCLWWRLTPSSPSADLLTPALSSLFGKNFSKPKWANIWVIRSACFVPSSSRSTADHLWVVCLYTVTESAGSCIDRILLFSFGSATSSEEKIEYDEYLRNDRHNNTCIKKLYESRAVKTVILFYSMFSREGL